MLAVTWLLLEGSWTQVRLNTDVSAPSTGCPMAIMYVPGVIFAAMAGLILLTNLWRVLTGQLSSADLVMVQASEEAAQLEEILGATEPPQPGARPSGSRP